MSLAADLPRTDHAGSRRRQFCGSTGRPLIDAASLWIRQLASEFELDERDTYRIDLCLTELVTNNVFHGGTAKARQRVSIEAIVAPDELTLSITDPGEPYDPFESLKPAMSDDIASATVGGHGLRLVRDFSNARRYHRMENSNRVELSFLLTRPARIPTAVTKLPRALDRRREALCSPVPPGIVDRRTGQDRREYGFLSWSRIFRGVSYAEIEDIVRRLPVRDYADAAVVLEPGQTNVEVLVVLRSKLSIWLKEPGVGEMIEIAEGGCVGEMSVIDGKPASAFVVAEPGTRVLVVDPATFVEKILTLRHVSRNLIVAMSERMRGSNELAIQRLRKEMELEQIQRDLQRASSIQSGLLPPFPLLAGEPRLDCAGRMSAARDVGGDFYDVFALDDHHVFFVVADVCGKGFPAALYMVRAIEGLRAQALATPDPGRHLADLAGRFNRQMCGHNEAEQFLTAFLGVIDLRNHVLHYVNAGHTPALLSSGGKSCVPIAEPINPVFGMYDGLAYDAGTLDLHARDMLLLYTDGVTEAENAGRQGYGESRLRACVDSVTVRTAQRLVDEVFASVVDFVQGEPPSDDITILALLCRETALPANEASPSRRAP